MLRQQCRKLSPIFQNSYDGNLGDNAMEARPHYSCNADRFLVVSSLSSPPKPEEPNKAVCFAMHPRMETRILWTWSSLPPVGRLYITAVLILGSRSVRTLLSSAPC